MGIFKTGSYVKYGEANYIITDVRAKQLVQLLNPNAEGVDSKKQVSIKNCELLPFPPAILVWDKGSKYIVTRSKLIISLASGNVVFSEPNHGTRKNILATAEMKWFKNTPQA